jgi:hypothetical protein
MGEKLLILIRDDEIERTGEAGGHPIFGIGQGIAREVSVFAVRGQAGGGAGLEWEDE